MKPSRALFYLLLALIAGWVWLEFSDSGIKPALVLDDSPATESGSQTPQEAQSSPGVQFPSARAEAPLGLNENPLKQKLITVSVSVARGGGTAPAQGALVWPISWVEPHADIPKYLLDPDSSHVINESGEIQIIEKAGEDRFTLVVEYQGIYKRLPVIPAELPEEYLEVVFDETISIQGRVLLNGVALQNAEIRLAHNSDGPVQTLPGISTLANINGEFEFSSLPKGTWCFFVIQEDLGTWKSKAYDLAIHQQSIIQLGIEGLERRTVQLYSANGLPMEGLDVSLTTEDWTIFGPVRTNKDGQASFMIDPSSPTQVSIFSVLGAVPPFPQVTDWKGEDNPLLVLEEITDSVEVRGLVLVGNLPASYGEIVSHQHGQKSKRTAVAPTDGSFVIDDVLPEAPLHLEYRRPGVVNAHRYSVAPDKLRDEVVLEVSAGSIAIKAVDAQTEKPIPGCPFVVLSEDGKRLPSASGGHLDPLGERTIANLAVGNYVAIVGSGVYSDFVEGAYETRPVSFSITESAPNATVTTYLEKGNYLNLEITDGRGNPLADSAVFFSQSGLPLSVFDIGNNTRTGHRKISGLPKGPIEVLVYNKGYGQTWVKAETSSNPDSPPQSITLEGARQVEIDLGELNIANQIGLYQRGVDGAWAGINLLDCSHGVARTHLLAENNGKLIGTLSVGDYLISIPSSEGLEQAGNLKFEITPGQGLLKITP